MYVIGITGGVGSGKSYAAHRLQEKLGATLLIADELGHVVMEPGRSAYCQIVLDKISSHWTARSTGQHWQRLFFRMRELVTGLTR